MTFQLSPGVYSFEQDNSQVVSDEAQNIVAQVGAFKRGTLKKKRVSTRPDFMSNYTNGTLDRSLGYSAYVAYTALENCKNLVIKRVVNNAKYAGLSVIKAGASDTESVQFLNGSTTDYENGGKEIKAISISGPLPTGYGLSVMLKNELSNESVEIVNSYSSTSSSNETLEAFAKLIQAQLDKWGSNGKAKVNKAWSGAPKQQIQKMSISRSMIDGESLVVTIEDLYLGKKTFTVDYAESNEKTLDALRLALNNTGYVFAYLDSTAENTLVITALSAGPDRITISTEATSVAEEALTVTIKQSQAGHGLYDDTTVAVLDPDNISVDYSDIQVIALPIDDAAIYTQVSAAAESGLILLSDVETVVGYVQSKKPITSIEYANELISQWATNNPYLKSVIISKEDEDEPVVAMKKGDTLKAIAILSNNTEATENLTYEWTDADDTDIFGQDATLELSDSEVGYRIKCKVTGYRAELSFTTSNTVANDETQVSSDESEEEDEDEQS